jgi:shikimate kinase
VILVAMGVCGCGKTTVGEALAQALGWPFFDAGDFHPEAADALVVDIRQSIAAQVQCIRDGFAIKA